MKESGEGRGTSFPSPQTPLPQEPSRDCCKSLGSSLGGMRRLLCGATARPALPVVKRLRLTACLAVFPRRNRLLLVLRSSSQLLLRRLCSLGFARKVHSHADCALAPSRCSHPCVERPTEGINLYREQSQNQFTGFVSSSVKFHLPCWLMP